jgi:hypothetical protein
MAKETVKVFAVAVRIVVFLEWSRKEEWGAIDPVVFFCATQRLAKHLLRTTSQII